MSKETNLVNTFAHLLGHHTTLQEQRITSSPQNLEKITETSLLLAQAIHTAIVSYWERNTVLITKYKYKFVCLFSYLSG
jgi:hypothetical protein